MSNKIIYIAELDADVDDVIAIEYLHGMGLLEHVVLDPIPVEKLGKQRLQMIEDMGILTMNSLSGDCENVFCGGQLTEIARHIKSGGTIKNLVLQGGFVGANIMPFDQQLKKFKGKDAVRTFNFNCDVVATDFVLKTTEKQIGHVYCVGKNVCHNPINSDGHLWKGSPYHDLFKKYDVRNGKLQHDMLACHEGIVMLGLGEHVDVKAPFCNYLNVRPFNTGLNGNKTAWGSRHECERTGYRIVCSAITFTKDIECRISGLSFDRFKKNQSESSNLVNKRN